MTILTKDKNSAVSLYTKWLYYHNAGMLYYRKQHIFKQHLIESRECMHIFFSFYPILIRLSCSETQLFFIHRNKNRLSRLPLSTLIIVVLKKAQPFRRLSFYSLKLTSFIIVVRVPTLHSPCHFIIFSIFKPILNSIKDSYDISKAYFPTLHSPCHFISFSISSLYLTV